MSTLIFMFWIFAIGTRVKSIPIDSDSDHQFDSFWKDLVFCGENKTLQSKPIDDQFSHCQNGHVDSSGSKCFFFCQARTARVLGDDQLPSRELMMVLTSIAFPEQYHERAIKHANECFDQYATKIKIDDESCNEAVGYMRCLDSMMGQEC